MFYWDYFIKNMIIFFVIFQALLIPPNLCYRLESNIEKFTLTKKIQILQQSVLSYNLTMEIVSKLIQLLPCITSKILVGLLIGVILFYIIRLILPEQVKNLDPIATAEKTYAGFQEFFEPSAISTFFGLDTTEKTDAGFQEFVEPGEKSKFLEPSAITIKKDASSKELFKHEFIHPDFDELIEPIGNSEYPESSLLKERFHYSLL